MTHQEQVDAIIGYAAVLNSEFDGGDSLSELIVETVFDRVLLYLNYPSDVDVLDERLLRVVAQVVLGAWKQAYTTAGSTEADRAISSVSDNGQSVSYANEVQNYLATADDNALFSGFASLLARYRRVHVITD